MRPAHVHAGLSILMIKARHRTKAAEVQEAGASSSSSSPSSPYSSSSSSDHTYSVWQGTVQQQKGESCMFGRKQLVQ